MMTSSPKVIVIDNDLSHLTGLADALERHGVPCHRVHYMGNPDDVIPCPDVRLVIADLHLGGDGLGFDPTTDFGVLSALLENGIKPSDPYSILLWTMYPEYASEFHAFLQRLRGVPRPFVVTALAKADHLDNDGRVRDEEELYRRIDTLADGWIRPRGALALVGAWGELDDEEVDALVEEIYAARRRGMDRPEERQD